MSFFFGTILIFIERNIINDKFAIRWRVQNKNDVIHLSIKQNKQGTSQIALSTKKTIIWFHYFWKYEISQKENKKALSTYKILTTIY